MRRGGGGMSDRRSTVCPGKIGQSLQHRELPHHQHRGINGFRMDQLIAIVFRFADSEHQLTNTHLPACRSTIQRLTSTLIFCCNWIKPLENYSQNDKSCFYTQHLLVNSLNDECDVLHLVSLGYCI